MLSFGRLKLALTASSGLLLILSSLAPQSYAQTQGPIGVSATGPCRLAQVAFCDPLDTPAPTGNRAGDLNGVVWGASRFGGNVSAQGLADQWEATVLNLCGTNVPAATPPNDIRICDGQLVEAANDHGGTLGLAAYPKQPFDFAGRTGLVTFDLGDDSGGTHAAWPQFIISDQPIPVPHPNVVDPTTWNLPRNAIGISLAAGCGSCPGNNFPPSGNTSDCVTADEAWLVTNHSLTTYGVYQNNGFTIQGCVIKGSVGHLNHFAINFSQTSPNIMVWATDPDSTTYRLIAEGVNMPLPLTRGLTWLEDNHYNGCKDQVFGPECQGQHTFAWANWGFDGPILPRDLTFDVPDNTRSLGVDNYSGQQAFDLGYVTAKGTLTLQIPNVTNVEDAVGALLVFNAQPVNSETVTYSVNGHAPQTFDFAPVTVSSTVAIPVNLGDLVDGNNTVTFTASDTANFTAFANMDLILQGAGGTGGGTPVPTPTSTATPTLTSTPSATPSPSVSPTQTPASATPTLTPVPSTATPSPTDVPTDTPIPTDTPSPTPTITPTPSSQDCVLQASQGGQVIWTAVVPVSACSSGSATT